MTDSMTALFLVIAFYGALIAPVVVWAFMVVRRLQKIADTLERIETRMKGNPQ